MKKCIYIIGMVLMSVGVYAQDAYDALKYAGRDMFGTARYIGMSGAFAALGGDPSAVKDNPAALGVFRKTDVSITLDINTDKTMTNWPMDNPIQTYTARSFRLSCGQVNYVQNFPTLNVESGLITHSFTIGYHRLKNFNREIYAQAKNQTNSFTDFLADFSYGKTEAQIANGGFNNDNVSWLTVLGYEAYILDPDTVSQGNWFSPLNVGELVTGTYESVESGWIDEYNVGWGANISNKLYFGLLLAIRAMQYSKNVTYSEMFGAGGNFSLNTIEGSYDCCFPLQVNHSNFRRLSL